MLTDKATAEVIPIKVIKSSDFCFSKHAKCIKKVFTNKMFLHALKLFETRTSMYETRTK